MSSEQFQVLIKTIRMGDLSEFEDYINDFKVMKFLDLPDSLEFEKIKDDIEKRYYLTLSELLSSLRFNEFSQLINYSDEMGIFIEVKKIPFRLKIIARLHLDGMGRGIIGRIFEIIRFFNDYNLFEMDLTKIQLEIIEDIKRNDKPLIANLRDLFGKVSNSLIYYSCKIMPYDLLLSNEERARRYLTDLEQIRLTLSNEDQLLLRRGYSLNYLKRFTDWYSMYGLSVRNLGSVEEFIDIFEEYYEERIIELRNDQKFLDFNLRYGNYYIGVEDDQVYRETKKHFMSPENILKNREEILNRDNYNFYSISMVLFGGLGPEGLGFTYSTPRGEIVEICSDQKETEAIIIKFKQYLKEKFLDKLEKEMVSLNINANIRKKITNILLVITNFIQDHLFYH